MTKRRIHSRLAFEEKLAALSDGAVSMALIDLDHFMEVNDNYGHAVGDEVLAQLEETLISNAPPEALLGRIGGDEYAVALPLTSSETALILLEEVRQHFSSRPQSKKLSTPVGMSVGIASKPPHADSVQDLLRAAAEALLRAKKEGAGRVAIYVDSKMTLKSNYYPKAALERLSKLSSALNRTEASLLREALDGLFNEYSREL